MVLYISESQTSISGLKINLKKILGTFPFILADQLKCLGVITTSKYKDFFQENFVICMEKIKRDTYRTAYR
uniref:Uncharacterized protein n=1 Tax=Erpetoichthys calabaricus TaxID=27687 RepID=A0A8C4X8L9_ERPCA